ncbi:hypothetical protein Tco_1104065 [Tanacetum coccineum]
MQLMIMSRVSDGEVACIGVRSIGVVSLISGDDSETVMEGESHTGTQLEDSDHMHDTGMRMLSITGGLERRCVRQSERHTRWVGLTGECGGVLRDSGAHDICNRGNSVGVGCSAAMRSASLEEWVGEGEETSSHWVGSWMVEWGLVKWIVIQNGNSKKRISTRKRRSVRILPPDYVREVMPNQKKSRKVVLKQQFEAFSISSSEGLEKGYDSKSNTNKVKSGAYSTYTPTSSNNIQEREVPAGFADEQQLSLNEQLTFQANEIYAKDEKLKRYRRIGMKAVKEKEQLKKTVDSWKDSSKNLWKLVDSGEQMKNQGTSLKFKGKKVKDNNGKRTEKKMAREAEFKKQRVFNTGNGVAKLVWNNAHRVNHANHFVPRPVQLNAVRQNVNSVSLMLIC